MAKMLKKLARSRESFYAIREDYEYVEIERNCESGQLRIMRFAEDRWRMPDELVAHLQWCIEQVQKLPPQSEPLPVQQQKLGKN